MPTNYRVLIAGHQGSGKRS